MTTETTYPELSKLVILCGVGCGGTTLMLDMLRAHPRVLGAFDLGWLASDTLTGDGLDKARTDPIYTGAPGPDQTLPEDLLDVENTLPGELPGQPVSYRTASILARRAGEGSDNWRELYKLVFGYLAKRDKLYGRDIFVDKQPAYSGSLLSHVYPRIPDALTIVVVRDPRAVYCSLSKRRAQDIMATAAEYSRLVRGALAALDAGKPVLLVRFEELVLFPELHMLEVARFLGIDYDPAMTDPANSYDQHIKTKFTFPPWNEQKRKLRPSELDSTAIDEWRELLQPGEADALVAALPSDLHWTFYDSGKDLPSGPSGA